MSDPRKYNYNNGVHTSKDGGKGSRRRRNAPEIPQDKWDAIFKKKEQENDPPTTTPKKKPRPFKSNKKTSRETTDSTLE